FASARLRNKCYNSQKPNGPQTRERAREDLWTEPVMFESFPEGPMKQKGAVSTAQQGFEGWLVPPAVTRIFCDIRFRIDTPALAIAFATDGTAWSVEEEGILRHWNANNGQELAHYQLSDLETVWAFAADAALVASGGTDFSIWETKDGRYRFTVTQHSWV